MQTGSLSRDKVRDEELNWVMNDANNIPQVRESDQEKLKNYSKELDRIGETFSARRRKNEGNKSKSQTRNRTRTNEQKQKPPIHREWE